MKMQAQSVWLQLKKTKKMMRLLRIVTFELVDQSVHTPTLHSRIVTFNETQKNREQGEFAGCNIYW